MARFAYCARLFASDECDVSGIVRSASVVVHEDIRVLHLKLTNQEVPRRDVSPAGWPVEPTHPALKMRAMRGAGVVV
jgi:hypothetical protein